jgi:hypothetical protein
LYQITIVYMLRNKIMQECKPFNLKCSIYLSSIKEYVYSSNDILNTCSPINAFSQKKNIPNTVTLQYSLSINVKKHKKKKKRKKDHV